MRCPMRFELPERQLPGTTRRVFLWFPRIVDGYFIWLEHVWRRYECDKLAPTNCGYHYSLWR